jgi:hypothetical protein
MPEVLVQTAGLVHSHVPPHPLLDLGPQCTLSQVGVQQLSFMVSQTVPRGQGHRWPHPSCLHDGAPVQSG